MTTTRHHSRQTALQLLYALEYSLPTETLEQVARRFVAGDVQRQKGYDDFAQRLVIEVWENRAALDQAIEPLLHNWTIERLPILERHCLRMALCEMEIFADIPLRVTLDEYIEMARDFGAEESTQYINAVLDRLARQFRFKDYQKDNAQSKSNAQESDS